jgi:hypothetical protein
MGSDVAVVEWPDLGAGLFERDSHELERPIQ